MSLNLDTFSQPWPSFLTESQLVQLKQETTCSICLDPKKPPVMTACYHVFCKACLDQVLSLPNGCPLCRRNIVCINANPYIAFTKKILGLGRSVTALDFLDTENKQWQYRQCRAKIQDLILASSQFNGPWSCKLPGNLDSNVTFRLRHQLELRGFGLKLVESNKKIYCRIFHQKLEDAPYGLENGWNPDFTSGKVVMRGKHNLNLLQERIQNSNLSASEKKRRRIDAAFMNLY